MSTSLNWLLDGIAAVPANDSRVEDLTLDSREARAGSLFLALQGRTTHGLKFAARGRGARRQRGAVGTRRRCFAAAPAGHRVCGGDTGLEHARGAHCRPILQLAFIAAAHHRDHGHQRQDHLRLLAGAMPREARLAGGLCRHHRLGPNRGARSGRAHHARCGHPASRARSACASKGVREVAMEVSSQALDQDRIAGVRMHSAAFTNLSARSPRLSRDHGRLRRRQGAPVRCRGPAAHRHQCRRRLWPRAGAAATTGAYRSPRSGSEPATRAGSPTARCARPRSRWICTACRCRSTAVSAKPKSRTRLLGRFNAENALIVMACLLALGVLARRCGARSRRMRAAAGTHGSGRARRTRQAGGRRRLRSHA